MNRLMGSESKKIGTLSFISKSDDRPIGITVAHMFNRVGEEVLIQQEGKWYKFGYVESIKPDIDIAMIRLYEQA